MTLDAAHLTRNLVGQMEIEKFNREIREKRATKFESAFDLVSLAAMFDLSAFESLLANDMVPTSYIDIVTNGLPKRLADVQRGSGKSNLAVVIDSLQRGATIRMSDIQRFNTGLNRLVREIGRYFAARSQINVYLTPPSKTGFGPHFDTTDIFIVQCLGSKEWKIFHDYTERIELPLLETPWDPERYKPSSSPDSLTLRTGDVLYLPRGAMHQAHCAEHESMHLTISIAPLTFADIIGREIKRLAETDVEIRKRLPWSVDGGDEEFRELSQRVKNTLVEIANGIDVAALLRAEGASLKQEPTGIFSGELEAALANLADAGVANQSG